MLSALTACPNCGNSLFQVDNTLRCSRNHSFDISKGGYVNLFPPNQKHSQQPGDTKEMVLARRRFLESGKYNCFASGLSQIVFELLDGKSRCNFLDIGCGEGYYTNYIGEHLFSEGKAVDIFAFDISKWAIKLASKKYNQLSFAVASAFHMPVKDSSVDLAINIFSPLVPEEVFRCLNENGFFVYAVPGKRHLFGLKEILYDKPYENERKDTEYLGLEFVRRVEIENRIFLTSQEDIFNLFAMTPYYWKTPKDGVEKLKNTNQLETEISFDFLIFKKAEKEI